MNLAVFDIDGTLTLGHGLGTRCFFFAFGEVFGEGLVDARLDGYAQSTDCGIAREAALRALGRPAGDHEIERFKVEYLARLEAEIAQRPSAYRPVVGADHFLAMLAARSGWSVAIATGNWRRAARLKLESAGIVPPAVAACSEDGNSRAGVLASAVRAASMQNGSAFDRVVYVGDQLWDLQAAYACGAGFLGVGSQAQGRRLTDEGARVVASFADPEQAMAMLEAAADGA